MRKPVAVLVFLVGEIVLLPVTIVGANLFVVVFVLGILGKSISLTAYELLFVRWVLDALGKREDRVTRQLFQALPGISPIPLALAFLPTVWLLRATGLTIQMYDYPLYSSSGLFVMHGHRTTFFDEAVLKYVDTVEQVVFLGAGWDTRAYGIAQQDGVRVFEVDTVGMQALKRQSLEKADIDTNGVIFASANFNRGSWLDALKRAGFDPDQPTLVVWEGVTYYLEEETVARTFQTVATELAQGSAIAFDYAANHIIEGDASLPFRLALIELELLREPWRFGIPTDPPAEEQLAELLQQHGLALAEFEPFGNGDGSQRLDGGLALAVNDR